MFLYTQPPSQLKFYPYGNDLYAAHGGIITLDKQTGEVPDLEFYRFEFVLLHKNRMIEKAHFILERLENLHENTVGAHVSWQEEREGVDHLIREDENNKEEILICDHDHALNFWAPIVADKFEEIKTHGELKRIFSDLMDDVFVVRHYFETEWVILTGKNPIKINFKNFHKL